MKTLSEILKSTQIESSNSFEILTEQEMQIVRGGIEPTRPISRPKDIYDEEEN